MDFTIEYDGGVVTVTPPSARVGPGDILRWLAGRGVVTATVLVDSRWVVMWKPEATGGDPAWGQACPQLQIENITYWVALDGDDQKCTTAALIIDPGRKVQIPMGKGSEEAPSR